MLRNFLRVGCMFLAVLSLLAGSVASARSPADYDEPTFPLGYRPPIIHPGTQQQGRVYSISGDQPIEAQAIALGKPGTIFGSYATFGTNRHAYLDSPNYVNGPSGVVVDPSHNVYIIEEPGARLLKYNSSGVLQWQAGIAGFHDWGATGLNMPHDVARAPDGSIWVADNDIVTQFDPVDGIVLQHFPSEPWNVDWDEQLVGARGIAFDTAGRMYVTDHDRSVVRVYTFDGEGIPQYAATIGELDDPGDSDDQFAWPVGLVVDSSNRLYVADANNARVQRCTPTGASWPWDWECATFHGNGEGDQEDQVNHPNGLGIDSSNNIYIADMNNWRVKKCTPAGDCSILLNGPGAVSDVGVDPGNGTVYVSYMANHYVRSYQANGSENGVFAGDASGVPYQTDNQHFNMPRSVRVDSKGNIIFVEELGHRLIKLKPDGTLLWAHGLPGISGGDDALLEWPHGVAIDASGNIWVGGSGSHVRLYSGKTGDLLSTFDWGYGDGPRQFRQVTGVAVDAAKNLYIADIYRQQVLVYNKAGVLIREMGEYGVCAIDNLHFCEPWGITVDKAGNLYVADLWNARVQKFDKKGKFVQTFGTLVQGDRLDQLSGPMDVFVDAKGRVFVADDWNNRVVVYDKTGAYLTSIAGQWSANSGGLRGAAGVAVDSKGYVYVADQYNHRIQKYSPGVPYAAQLNIDGFGKRSNTVVSALSMFKGKLYAGTYNNSGWGAQIWRQGKTGWEVVIPDGFMDGANITITSLQEYKGYLYAGTYLCAGEDCAESDSRGGMLYRTQDGLTWERISGNGFNRDEGARSLQRIMVLGDGSKICVRTAAWVSDNGAEIFCSSSGDRGTWTLMAQHGMNDPNNHAFPSWAEYNGAYYVGTMNWETGGQVWRKEGTSNWQRVNADGFGNPLLISVSSMGVFNGYLYAGTLRSNADEDNPHGFSVYRCKVCTGSDWQPVETNGFGNPNNVNLIGLRQIGKELYAFVENPYTGVEIWRTMDGESWNRFMRGGISNSNNRYFYYDNAFVVSGKNIYIGTNNEINGGQLWKICTATKTCK